MLKFLFLCAVLTLSSVSAEDAPKGDSLGFKAWQNLSEVILSGKEKESAELMSGRMLEGFYRFGMQSIMNEVQGMEPVVFVREFTDKKKEKLYLTVNVKGDLRTLIFLKKENVWLFDDQTNLELDTPQSAEEYELRNKVVAQLLKISELVTSYFADAPDSLIPDKDKLKIGDELLTYTLPTGEKKRILLASGCPFKGSGSLLLAVTESKLGETHIALFENGEIAYVHEGFVQQNMQFLNQDPSKLAMSDEEFAVKITALGADSFKERKAAKLELLKLGAGILSMLEKYKDSKDFEVQISVKEISEALIERQKQARPEYKANQ
jgi:hypothetical protein